MIRNFTQIALLLLTATSLQAQTVEKCAAVSIERSAIEKNPALLDQIADLEAKTAEFILNNSANPNKGIIILTIPVVVHVIHNGEPVGNGTNISDAKIMTQLSRLNEDFRKMNADALPSTHPYYSIQADCYIEFCLAQTDPDGNATTGINRYDMSQASWTMADIDTDVKPTTIWDRNDYMNIWSVNIQDPSAPGVDGYGTFPATANDQTDGIVIANTSFGTLANGDKAITGTHEVGHYLNLRHVWGDNQPDCGDDLVSDTPPSAEPNSGCPMFPHNPNDACGTGANGDIFMNFMDYSDAVCTVMYTVGQRDRMHAAIATYRSGLLASTACVAPNVGINELDNLENSFEIYPNPSNSSFTIDSKNGNLENISISVYNLLGATVSESVLIDSFPYNLNLSNCPEGVYYVKFASGTNSVTKKVFKN